MEKPQCTLCNNGLDKPVELAMTVCQQCAMTIGMVPMPPLTRPPVPCSKCNSLKFLRVVPREHYAFGFERVYGRAAPMYVTHPPSPNKTGLSTQCHPLDPSIGYGLIEMFVCHGCGFIEWYAPAVTDIPVHKHLNTEIVDYSSNDGPFR
jgi:hypothetical protein